eukprot:TRINITY_DN30205_c4_g1_i1.p1 TRINITY_DN30205_c4_g1~~TRINITY_DN30205_c4_g1_i1.p1  ORF type:complete len:149 (-),score=5.01 TRINITY_DN30205_c4_g1_i1:42-488(-)
MAFARLAITLALTIGIGLQSSTQAQDSGTKLAAGLKPLLRIASGKEARFALAATVEVTIDRTKVPVEMRLVRFDEQSFNLELTHPQYSVNIRRRRDETAFALPHHKVVFIGKGATDEKDHLSPQGVLTRLISPASQAAVYAPLLKNGK